MIPKKIEYRLFILLVLCFTTNAAFAQLSKQNLIGRYNMNHDGSEGTLVVEQKKMDCNSSPWCDLKIYYIDLDNNTHRGKIWSISEDGQHITFVIRFLNHPQLFQGHFFNRDKNVMAGTIMGTKGTSGFYARKKQQFTFDGNNLPRKDNFRDFYKLRKIMPGTAEPREGEEENGVVKRKVNKNGNVEIHYQNGRKKIYYARGGLRQMVITPEEDTIIQPRLTPQMAVMDLEPPIPEKLDIDEWFERFNANMDEIVQHLLNDEESFGNYQSALSEYSSAERINRAMGMIVFLIME